VRESGLYKRDDNDKHKDNLKRKSELNYDHGLGTKNIIDIKKSEGYILKTRQIRR